MKTIFNVAALAFLVSLSACGPTPQRAVNSTRPLISGTAYEAQQAKHEREREDAAIAAEATQKQIDALRKELDDLKSQQPGTQRQIQTDAEAAATRAAIRKLRDDIAPKARTEQPQPAAPRADPNAKAIDAEVAGILSGEHGKLPPAQKLRGNTSGIVSIKVKNDTAHTLTVSYSGPTSKQSILAARQSETINLAAGPYSVAARVNDPSVIPFAGKDTLSGGDYSNTFYIVTSSN